MIRISVCIILSIISVILGNAQETLEMKLNEVYGKYKEKNIPGFSISIIKGGEIVLSKGYGVANIEHSIPFTPATISDLGSVSKQLTVFGVIMLADKGKLSLEDDIRTHLNDLPDLGQVVKIRHLIHHTSGMSDIYGIKGLQGMRSGDLIMQEDAIHYLNKRPAVDFVPGSKYRYSNTGYMLLAEIVKHVSGKGFEEWMQQNIFGPLSMTKTGIMDAQGEVFNNMADSYRLSNYGSYLKVYDNSTLQGAGGVYSTGEDMLRWIDNFRTRMLGNESIFSSFLQHAILNDGTEIEYAGGINVNFNNGLKRYTHNGSSAGCRTKMAYYPDHELGFIIKSNTPEIGYDEFDMMEDLILSDILDLEINVPKKEIEEPESKSTTKDLLSLELSDYIGKYFSEELDMTLDIESTDTSLILKNYLFTLGELDPSEKDKFQRGGFQVKFERNSSGEISYVLLHSPRASNISLKKKKQ